ncbi:hypothetical protein HY024_01215 [Candidatus Curtissbacteria bacterium]|nr:hypothetical protein [Candidatus Curtissbacteria bacterium]
MRSLLLLVLILSVVGLPLYLYAQKHLSTPKPIVVETAKTLPKYPTAKYWLVDEGKQLCIEQLFNCGNSIPVTFTTEDKWESIYGYFRQEMAYYNWTTNSQVFTSVPGSIVFGRDNCQAILSPNYGFMQKTTQNYKIDLTCQPKEPGQ